MSLNLNFYMENTLLSEKSILQNNTRSKILFGGNHTLTNIHVYKRKCFYDCYGFSLKLFMLSVRVCIRFCFLNTMKTKNRECSSQNVFCTSLEFAINFTHPSEQ